MRNAEPFVPENRVTKGYSYESMIPRTFDSSIDLLTIY